MVEYKELDNIFHSLADPTRRDILLRLRPKEQTVGELAEHYELTFAAVSKHIKVLEQANLIQKRKQGREQWIGLSVEALKSADKYLAHYKKSWEQRLDRMETFLKTNKK